MKKLFDLEPAEVSLVPRGANKRKFLIFKSRGGNSLMKEETEKSLAADMEAKKAAPQAAAPSDDSDSPGMSDKAMAAAKAIQRIFEPFKEELGPTMAKMFGPNSNDDEDGEDLSFDDEPAADETPATPSDAPAVTKDDDMDEDMGSADGGGDDEVDKEDDMDNAKAAHVAGMEAYQRAVKNHATKATKAPVGKLGYQKYPTAVETQKSKDGMPVKGEVVGKSDSSFDASKVEMIFKSNQELIKKNAELEEIIKEERKIRREKEFIAKANSFKHYVGDRVELAKTLMSLADTSKEASETFERNLTALSNQSEAISKGLFSEVGSSLADSGSVEARIEAAASAYVAKSGENLTKEQAYDRFIRTPEGQRMYSEYAAPRRGISE